MNTGSTEEIYDQKYYRCNKYNRQNIENNRCSTDISSILNDKKKYKADNCGSANTYHIENSLENVTVKNILSY